MIARALNKEFDGLVEPGTTCATWTVESDRFRVYWFHDNGECEVIYKPQAKEFVEILRGCKRIDTPRSSPQYSPESPPGYESDEVDVGGDEEKRKEFVNRAVSGILKICNSSYEVKPILGRAGGYKFAMDSQRVFKDDLPWYGETLTLGDMKSKNMCGCDLVTSWCLSNSIEELNRMTFMIDVVQNIMTIKMYGETGKVVGVFVDLKDGLFINTDSRWHNFNYTKFLVTKEDYENVMKEFKMSKHENKKFMD